MTPEEAAAALRKAPGTIREYCRGAGVPKVKGMYDIDTETVEEWRHSPPSVNSMRKEHGREPKPESLDGPPIKSHVLERVPDALEARKARRRRLLEAMRRAGL